MKLPIFVYAILVFALFLHEIEAKKQCRHLKGKQKADCLKQNRSSNSKRCAGLKGKERAKCMKRGPDPNTNEVPQPGSTNKTTEKPPKFAFDEPLGHNRIQLVGNTTYYNAGLISVHRNNSWGYVCDDNWDIKDADVACKQLGFARGAEKAVGSSRYGLAKSKNFLMDNINCNGDEKALQYCSYDTEHDCAENEAAGVICKTNPGCKAGWISGPTGCYRLFIGNAQRYNAKEMCYTKNSNLAVIESLEENKFLSVLLKANIDNHVWLTDGFRYGRNWAWRSQRKSIATHYWFPGWKPNNRFAQPSKKGKCISLSNMFEYNSELYMINYFFWKASDCNVVTGFICEQQKKPNFTEDCYTGNGANYRGMASHTVRGTLCLKWTESRKYNSLNSPNAGLGDHNYCRNPDNDDHPWCWVAPAYKNLFGYCKIDQCKNVTESTTSTSVTTFSTTIKQTVAPTTASTRPTPTCSNTQMHCNSTDQCIPLTWKCDGEFDCRNGEDEKNCEEEATCPSDSMMCQVSRKCIPLTWKCDGESDCHDGEDEKDCEEEASCPNDSMTCHVTQNCIPLTWKCDGEPDCPNGEDENQCATTHPNLDCPPGKIHCLQSCIPEQWKCDGQKDCSDGSDEENCTIVTTTEVPVTTTPSMNCPADKLYCSVSKTCISLNWKCDGENDCSDGEDENDCVYTLDQFKKQDLKFLIDALPKEVYIRIPLETCARICLRHREFVCKAFHYRESDKKCKLFDTAKSLVLRPLSSGFFYLLSQNCSDTDFQCDNGRCIPNEEKCNGRDDCNDFSDEQVCGIPEQIEIRLADGQENSGRVEIKYHNEWGVVCDDKWDIRDANVVCRMLGYRSALKAVPFSNFGPGNGNFLLTNVECLGNETSLLECSRNPWRQHNCKKHETAGVICKLDKGCRPNYFECANSQCVHVEKLCNSVDNCGDNSDEEYCTPSVTLVNGSNPSNGRVEITMNNITGTVCDDNFDNIDATVICKQLGYKSGIAMPGGTYGEGNGIIWFDEVDCDGSEANIHHCEGNPTGVHDCEHTEDVGVQCSHKAITTTALPTTSTVATTTEAAPVCGKIPRLIRTKRADRIIAETFYSKIVKGQDAVYGRYPWQVAVLRITSQYSSYITTSHFCGGTIVHKDWIISAAHCFVGKKKEGLIVKAGDHNNKVWDKYEQTFRVAELITHPKYDDNTYDYDMAMLKLEPNKKGNGIIFNDYVQPACLPDTNTTFPTGERCHISGWGNTGKAYPSILKAAIVPLIGRKVCKSLYKNSITPRMLCAGFLEGGIDSCQGDSGGPLVCNKKGVYVLTGVTSWGNGCAQPRNPGVYTKVQELEPWIKYIMKKYS